MHPELWGVSLLLDWLLFWYFFFFRFRQTRTSAPVRQSARFRRTAPLIFAALGTWMFAAWVHAMPAPVPEFLLGGLLLLAGQGMMLASRHALRFLSNYDLLFSLCERHISSGVYRYNPHPMYVGLFLALVGSSLLLGSLLSLFVAVLCVGPILVLRACAEK